MENKIKRAKNFTSNDKMRLVELITASPVLLSKSTGGPNYILNTRLKDAAWNQILTQYNSGSSSQRSLVALKKAWDNLKREARMQRASVRCHVFGTGGGPSQDIEDPVLLKVEAALGISSSGLGSQLDSNTPAVREPDNAANWIPLTEQHQQLEQHQVETEDWSLEENPIFTVPEMVPVPPLTLQSPVMSAPAVPPLPSESPVTSALAVPPSVPRKAFKRRLCLKKTVKDSLLTDLQKIAAAKLEAEGNRIKDMQDMEAKAKAQADVTMELLTTQAAQAKKQLEMLEEERLGKKEERLAKAAESAIRQEILKEQLVIARLEREAKEISLKKLQSECP